jgi:hypothetical protein
MEASATMAPMSDKPKDPAAVELGRRGGKVKTAKGFAKMDPAKRTAAQKKGGSATRKKKPLTDGV